MAGGGRGFAQPTSSWRRLILKYYCQASINTPTFVQHFFLPLSRRFLFALIASIAILDLPPILSHQPHLSHLAICPSAFHLTPDLCRISFHFANLPVSSSTTLPCSAITVTMPAATSTVNGTGPSANDNISRFSAPSRPLSPGHQKSLFHEKTRCLV